MNRAQFPESRIGRLLGVSHQASRHVEMADDLSVGGAGWASGKEKKVDKLGTEREDQYQPRYATMSPLGGVRLVAESSGEYLRNY
jgi:hypothetical protein